MIIVIVIAFIILAAALIYLIVLLHRMRSNERKEYHSRIIVSGGKVVTNAASDSNELTYGENQYNETLLPGETAPEMGGGAYILHLTQELNGFEDQAIFTDAIEVGRAESSYGHFHVEGKGISRRHCRFFMSGGYLYVEDLGSGNGTFLNGARISGPALVQNYDTVTMGNIPYEAYIEIMR